MKRILIVFIAVVIMIAQFAQIVDARGPRHYDTTQDEMMTAAQRVAGDDAKKAYEIYKQMKEIKRQEQREAINSEAYAMFLTILSAIILLSVYCFFRAVQQRRFSWKSLVVTLVCVVAFYLSW